MRVSLLALIVLLPTAASAFEVAETAFEVYHMENGAEVSEATTIVPLTPENETCWSWFIRSAEATGEITFTEKLIMPVAPESWGDVNEIPEGQIGPLVVEDDGRVGIHTQKLTLDEGWFGNRWCLLAGDPTGPHVVEVTVEDEMVHRFEFEVVAPPSAPPPARVVRRSERSGRFSL